MGLSGSFFLLVSTTACLALARTEVTRAPRALLAYQEPPKFEQVFEDDLNREYIMECRYFKGVKEPKQFRFRLNRDRTADVVSPKNYFHGFWFPKSSAIAVSTTGLRISCKRFDKTTEESTNLLVFDVPIRFPLFQPNAANFGVGKILVDDKLVGNFKVRLPGLKPLVDPQFKAYRNWIKQRPW